MSGERNTRVIDDALLQWRRDHCMELAITAAIRGDLQGAQHVAAVGRIESAGDRFARQRDMQDLQRAGGEPRGPRGGVIHDIERHAQTARAFLEQTTVRHNHDACRQASARELHAQVGADARWLAGRDRDRRRHYLSSRRYSI